jgi:hypothetical protein
MDAQVPIQTILQLMLMQNGLDGRMNVIQKPLIFLFMLSMQQTIMDHVLTMLRHLCHLRLMLHQVMSHLPSFLPL